MENKIELSGAGQISGIAQLDFGESLAMVIVGETRFSQVADRLGIPLEALMAANPDINPERIVAGSN